MCGSVSFLNVSWESHPTRCHKVALGQRLVPVCIALGAQQVPERPKCWDAASSLGEHLPQLRSIKLEKTLQWGRGYPPRYTPHRRAFPHSSVKPLIFTSSDQQLHLLVLDFSPVHNCQRYPPNSCQRFVFSLLLVLFFASFVLCEGLYSSVSVILKEVVMQIFFLFYSCVLRQHKVY